MTSSWKKSQRHPFFYFFSAIDRKTIKSWNGNFNMNPKYVVLFAFFDQTDHCGHFNFFKTLTVFTAVTQRIFVANFTFLCPVFKKIMRYVHTQPASQPATYIHTYSFWDLYIYKPLCARSSEPAKSYVYIHSNYSGSYNEIARMTYDTNLNVR